MSDQGWNELLADPACADAACITFVRGLSPEEALTRLGAAAPFSPRTLSEIDGAVMKLHERGGGEGEPAGAIAVDAGEGWVMLVEPNGWAGTIAGALAELSRGTEAVSLFWNVNGLAEITVARGEEIAVVHEVIDYVCGDEAAPRCGIADVRGRDPSVVASLVDELAAVRGYGWRPVALRWAVHHAGASLAAGWLTTAHPSAAFLRPR